MSTNEVGAGEGAALPNPADPESSRRIAELTEQKLRQEIAKFESDKQAAEKMYRLERFKTVAAILAPLATAASIIGAVVVVVLQNSAKNASDEDTYWRDTVKAVAETRQGDQRAAYLRTLLKPFLGSQRYGSYARGLALQELAGMRDRASFEDMFAAVFPAPGLKDFGDLTFVARGLTDQVRSYSDLIGRSTTSEPYRATLRGYSEIDYSALSTLCGPLTQSIHELNAQRRGRNTAAPPRPLALSNIYFNVCDFSNLDLSNADLTDSVLAFVKLDGVDLTGIKYGTDLRYLWTASTWWRAKAIDATLLLRLVNEFEPYHFYGINFATQYRDNETITKDEYLRELKRLCAAAHAQCPAVPPFQTPDAAAAALRAGGNN